MDIKKIKEQLNLVDKELACIGLHADKPTMFANDSYCLHIINEVGDIKCIISYSNGSYEISGLVKSKNIESCIYGIKSYFQEKTKNAENKEQRYKEHIAYLENQLCKLQSAYSGLNEELMRLRRKDIK